VFSTYQNELLLLEHAVDCALVLAFLDTLALVKLLLTPRYGDYQFSKAAIVDEQTQGHNRETRLQVILSDATYFLAVEQQLAVTMGGVVIVGTVTVLGNIHVFNPHLAVDDHAIGIGQSALALTDGLDLGPGQDDTRSERLDNLIVKRRTAVLDIDVITINFIIACHSKKTSRLNDQ